MLITSADLKTQTKNDLAQMAKRLGVSNWNALSKDQLVAAIVKQKKSAAKPSKSGTAKGATSKTDTKKPNKSAGKVSAGKAPSRVMAKAVKPVSKSDTKKGVVKVAKSATSPVGKVSKSAKVPITINGKSAHGKTNGSVASPSKAGKSVEKSADKSTVRLAGKSAPKAESKSAKPANSKAVAAKPTAKAVPPKKIGASKPVEKPIKPPKPAKPPKPVKPSGPPTNPVVLQRIRELQEQRESTKDLSKEFEEVVRIEPVKPEPVEENPQKDRIVLVVRDAYWLQVTWDITRRAVERARAAMAEHWHHAQPILRLLRLDDSGTTSAAETIERDIVIHGGVRNWYLDLNGTPGRFRVMIGYLSGNRFHMLAKSNIVRTPTPGTTDAVEDHWSDIARDAERIFALSGGYDSEQETTELQEVFEDRLKRSMGGPQLAQYGSGAETAFRGRGGFHFDMEVELYVYGSTVPDGFVTLNNEPVKLRSDGTFAMRLPFPDRRQVLPAVACSRDGVQQRTVVVAVERNTKVMEPFSKEQDDQG